MDFAKRIETFRTRIASATFQGATFSRRVSKYVLEDQVFVLKQNDYRFWVVSGRELTDEEFFSVILQYEERIAHPK